MPEMVIEKRVTIKRMFDGCPKPSGWFGCFAHVRGEGDIKLFGITNQQIAKDMVLDVKIEPSKRYTDGFELIEMKPVTKTKTGMISYLASIKGISRPTATRLVDRYGADTINKIKEDPDLVQFELSFSDNIMSHLKEGIEATDKSNQLRQMLPELSAQQIKRLEETMLAVPGATDLMELIKENPYRLSDIPGIPFSTADAVALRLGIDPLSPFRVNHGMIHLMDSGEMGNDTFINLSDQEEADEMSAKIGQLLKIRMDQKDELVLRARALAAVPESPIVIEKSSGGKEKMFLRKTYDAVCSMAKYVKTAWSRSAIPLMNDADIRCKIPAGIASYLSSYGGHVQSLTPEQEAAIFTSILSPVSVITGGPGRGKTTMLDCLAHTLMHIQPRMKIMLLAPTGKAMNKLRMATKNRYEHTMTIDRLIASSQPRKDMKKENQYVKDYNSQYTRFIIDESSMIDIEKMAELMALYPQAGCVFVGDVDQLPPIGKGRLLHDLIKCGKVPVSRLTVPMRNGGLILQNADAIAAGNDALQWDFMEMPFFPQEKDDEDTLQFIMEQYNEERQQCPDITDIALLCPIRKGQIGVHALNIAMQTAACPERLGCTPIYDTRRYTKFYSQKGHPIASTIYGDNVRWTRFHIGDIVMNTKNNYEMITYKYTDDDFWNGSPQNPIAGVFNGDCGKIIGYAPNWLPNDMPIQTEHEFIIIQLFSGRIIQVDVTTGEFEPFELAYAMTVHKAQGCEYDTVIYVSPNSMANMTRGGFAVRNLPYTAVTRAKRRVIVIGSKDSVSTCIKNPLPDCNTDFVDRV